MNSDEAVRAVAALKSHWHREPMSESIERAWLRTLADPLAKVTPDEFGKVLDGYRRTGGSQHATSPGMRPDPAEFMGSVQAQRHKAGRQPHKAEPWVGDPEVAKRELDRIRSSVPALAKRSHE